MERPDVPAKERFRGRVLSNRLTAQRAAWIIASFTVIVTLVAAVLAWLLDRDDFPNLGISAWWAVQTVTTVGYGDFVPEATEGRVIGAVVMVVGVGFVAVITASIAAAFVENARHRMGAEADPGETARKLDEVLARLERLEQRIAGDAGDEPPGSGGPR